MLDLGCGSGRDCYVCSALVGEAGHVTGIDMTPAQLEVARKYVTEWTQTLGYSKPNVTFVQGEIEALGAAGIKDESIDVIISNCVVNLSPDKASVLRVRPRRRSHLAAVAFRRCAVGIRALSAVLPCP